MKFFCESCGQKLEIVEDFSGETITCPSCSNPTPVPSGEAAISDAEVEQVFMDSLTIRESPGAGMTIAQLMADRNLEGGLQISRDVLEGDQNQKYEYGAMIARGGVGAIFSASDLNIRRNVAVKVLLEPKEATNEDILRFIEEAQVTGQLEHPSVVPVHDLGVDGAGNVYYTMKMVKGDNLHTILKRISRGDEETIREFPLGRLLNIYLKVLDAMRFAHSKGVIHRDLKPENIMVGQFGEVLVMDWGLAKVIGQSREDPHVTHEQIQSVRNQDASGALVTIAGTIFGTPQFMAPEQAQGATGEMDQRTDIYSLGAILYNILTLQPPVRGRTIDEVLTKVTSGEIPEPVTFNTLKGKTSSESGESAKAEFFLRHCPNEKIPSSLSAIVMQAMELKREDRYQDVAELQADVEAYQGGFATKAEKAGAVKLTQLFIQRNLLGFMSAVVISLLGIGFGLKTLTDAREIKRVSAAAAPEFVAKARLALREQKTDEAWNAVETAVALDKKSPLAWYEQARLYFDAYQFSDALGALTTASQFTIDEDLTTRISDFKDIVNRWRNRIDTDGKGVLPEHLIQMAPEVQDIDPTLAGRFFARVGEEQRALRIEVEEVFAELLEANPGLEWKKEERNRSWPMGIYQFYWSKIFQETGMELDLTRFCADSKKLVNIAPLATLPIKNLNLEGSSVSDLEPLISIETLRTVNLSNTPILTLTALKDTNVEELWVVNTRIEDLSPLAESSLKHIYLEGTRVSDFTPLAGLKLMTFSHRNFPGKDIEFLRGLPLRKLDLSGAAKLESLEPVKDTPIEELDITGNLATTDISLLKNMPLTRLAIGTPAATDLSILKGKDLEELRIGMDIDSFSFLKLCRVHSLFVTGNLSARSLDGMESQRGHLEELSIVGPEQGSQLNHIHALRGMKRLRNLRLVNLPVKDISALRGLPLENAELILPEVGSIDVLHGMKPTLLKVGGGINDVRALRGMTTLTELDLSQCSRLRNVQVLASLPNLEKVIFPEHFKEIGLLRRHRELREIGIGNRRRPAAEVWREFDKKRSN